MNTTDLAEQIAAAHELSKSDAKKIVEGVITAISDAASLPQHNDLRCLIAPNT